MGSEHKTQTRHGHEQAIQRTDVFPKMRPAPLQQQTHYKFAVRRPCTGHVTVFSIFRRKLIDGSQKRRNYL